MDKPNKDDNYKDKADDRSNGNAGDNLNPGIGLTNNLTRAPFKLLLSK